jgi:hypothetical protein
MYDMLKLKLLDAILMELAYPSLKIRRYYYNKLSIRHRKGCGSTGAKYPVVSLRTSNYFCASGSTAIPMRANHEGT